LGMRQCGRDTPVDWMRLHRKPLFPELNNELEFMEVKVGLLTSCILFHFERAFVCRTKFRSIWKGVRVRHLFESPPSRRNNWLSAFWCGRDFTRVGYDILKPPMTASDLLARLRRTDELISKESKSGKTRTTSLLERSDLPE
jgi:hypothetical protein